MTTTYISHAEAFRNQAEFAPESKIKVGKNIWSTGTAGERLFQQVLSKHQTSTVGKVIALASELKELPFTPKATMGHLRWLFTAGQLEVDGKSYVVQAKPKATKVPAKAKVEKPAKAKAKAETKVAATRKRDFVKTKKLSKAA